MFKSLLKNVVYSLVRWLPVKGAVVLMYHSVGDNPAFFTVKKEEFERQMEYLVKNRFKVILLSELVRILRAGRPIAPRTAAVTIDDGYQDNFTNAWPILKKYNLPAAIFVVTGSVGKTRTTRSGVTLPMLEWEQIKEMSPGGLVEFYPHTHTHPMLDTLSKEEVIKETAISKKILEEQLGREANIFAYPYGRHSQSVAETLKEEGWQAALTVKTGRIKNGDDLFLLKRNAVDSATNFSVFKAIVNYGRL